MTLLDLSEQEMDVLHSFLFDMSLDEDVPRWYWKERDEFEQMDDDREAMRWEVSPLGEGAR